MMTSSIKPLKGIKVIDFSRILAGPFATMILGDLGAEVIKVEPPNGDDARYWAPIINDVSVYFLSTNRGKKSIVIDLKRDEGREIVYRMIRDADIVIENFREGVADKLGIGYDTLREINSKIIYASIRGFRSKTIYSNKGGADLIIQAMSGLMDTTGEENGRPVKVSFALCDILTGLLTDISILSALEYRRISGEGMKIETPLYDSTLFSMVYIPLIYLMTGRRPVRMGSAHPSIVPYQAFECKDGKYIATGAFNEDMWRRFCEALDLKDIADDPRFNSNVKRVENRGELIAILSSRFKEKTCSEWISILEKYNVVVGPVYGVDEVFNDPYVKEAEIVTKMPHRVLNEIKQILYPSLFNDKRITPEIPPPEKGEHAREILKMYGYGDDEINELFRENIVCCI